jgi:hypothetical protein
MPNAEIERELIIEPCYIIYAKEKVTALMRLHTLWQDYNNDWNNGDTQIVSQAWHGIQALVQIFRDRGEWDEDKREPKPFFKNERVSHYLEIECHFCHCQCTWDEDAAALWDGLCPACGTMLDAVKSKEAA